MLLKKGPKCGEVDYREASTNLKLKKELNNSISFSESAGMMVYTVYYVKGWLSSSPSLRGKLGMFNKFLDTAGTHNRTQLMCMTNLSGPPDKPKFMFKN